MENSGGFIIYRANVAGDAKNCVYPVEVRVRDKEELKKTLQYDHVFAKFRDNRRGIENFEYSTLLVMDVDNESDDLSRWIWPEDMAELFPGVRCIIYSSRHNNIPKGTKSARPRFHVIFPIWRIENADEYAAVKKKLADLFPFFDNNALDAARFYFGVENSTVLFQPGPLSLTEFLNMLEADQSAADNSVIYEGSRNATLSAAGAGIIKRWGDTEEAEKRFRSEAGRCRPPLSEAELDRIWSSCRKFFRRISAQPGYIQPQQYALMKLPQWEKPIPLETETRVAFPVEALPKTIRDYVLAVSEFLQTPVDMAGSLSLAVLAHCLQGKYEVLIKKGWQEPLNLFVLPVAAPSERKSPCLKWMIRPVQQYEQEWNKAHKREIALSINMYGALKKRVEKMQKDFAADKITRAELDAADDDLRQFVVLREKKEYVDDITVERMATLMAENKGRLSVFGTESTLFQNLGGRYSNGAYFDVVLKGFSQDTIRVDREGRGEELIERPVMTIVQMAQPLVLEGMMCNEEFLGRGLVARILFTLPKSMVGYRNVNPPTVPDETASSYHELILRLLNTEPPETELITLSEEAEQVRLAFEQTVEDRLKTGEYSAIADWIGKIRGTTVRIAGLLCRAEAEEGKTASAGQPEESSQYVISKENMSNAVLLAYYFIEHAKIAYCKMGADHLIRDCKLVVEAIRREGLQQFTRRDIMRACRMLATAEAAQKVLDHLETLGYVGVKGDENDKKNFHGKNLYHANPCIFSDPDAA